MHRRWRVAGPGGRAGRWSEGGAIPSCPAPQSGRGAAGAPSRFPRCTATTSPADLHWQDTVGTQPATGLNETHFQPVCIMGVCVVNHACIVIPNLYICLVGCGAELVQSSAVGCAEHGAAGEQR